MNTLIFNKIKKAYFIGIGGIGMSALAQLFKHNGIVVTGSDRESSPVTNLLEQKGIVVTFGQRIDDVQKDVDVIIYSDAIEDAEPDFMNSVRA
ncbi:UDP-N-acetylmuramate--L-alanine ligase, partial [hydrothermal vent metagenome]